MFWTYSAFIILIILFLPVLSASLFPMISFIFFLIPNLAFSWIFLKASKRITKDSDLTHKELMEQGSYGGYTEDQIHLFMVPMLSFFLAIAGSLGLDFMRGVSFFSFLGLLLTCFFLSTPLWVQDAIINGFFSRKRNGENSELFRRIFLSCSSPLLLPWGLISRVSIFCLSQGPLIHFFLMMVALFISRLASIIFRERVIGFVGGLDASKGFITTLAICSLGEFLSLLFFTFQIEFYYFVNLSSVFAHI